MSISAEVCPIRRNLFSAVEIAEAGNDIVIGPKRAYITNHKTGKVTNLRRDRRVWVLDMWMRRPKRPTAEAGFQRPAP